MRLALAIGAALVAAPALGEDVAAPSGLIYEMQEIRFEPAGVPASSAKTLRLRYVSEQLAGAGAYDFSAIEGDFEVICQEVGAPIVSNSAPMISQIIVSLASEEVLFGETAPAVVQFFEAFHFEGEKCVPEGIH